jgi:hypothetical protein
MSLLERLLPSALTVARTVGTGLVTFPLGLTEEMMIAPPEPPPLLLPLVPDPVRLVAFCTLCSTAFLALACASLLLLGWGLLLQLLFRREGYTKPLLASIEVG